MNEDAGKDTSIDETNTSKTKDDNMGRDKDYEEEEADEKPSNTESFSCPANACPKRSGRKKRTADLPNQTAVSIQSRLIVPQSPVGLYLVWVKVKFFVRTMFTQSISDTGGPGSLGALLGSKRSLPDNFLVRDVASDQAAVLTKMEESLDRAGLSGRSCVLRAICELEETPIRHWTIVGDMLTTLLSPKREGNTTGLTEYQLAADRGLMGGDCWSHYPDCPFSIFNIIPDIYTKDEEIEVELEESSFGSNILYDQDEINRVLESDQKIEHINLDLDLTK